MQRQRLQARGLAGLRLLLAGSGLGPRWVEAYAGALAGPGALAAALAWYRAAGPSTLRPPGRDRPHLPAVGVGLLASATGLWSTRDVGQEV